MSGPTPQCFFHALGYIDPCFWTSICILGEPLIVRETQEHKSTPNMSCLCLSQSPARCIRKFSVFSYIGKALRQLGRVRWRRNTMDRKWIQRLVGKNPFDHFVFGEVLGDKYPFALGESILNFVHMVIIKYQAARIDIKLIQAECNTSSFLFPLHRIS